MPIHSPSESLNTKQNKVRKDQTQLQYKWVEENGGWREPGQQIGYANQDNELLYFFLTVFTQLFPHILSEKMESVYSLG